MPSPFLLPLADGVPIPGGMDAEGVDAEGVGAGGMDAAGVGTAGVDPGGIDPGGGVAGVWSLSLMSALTSVVEVS